MVMDAAVRDLRHPGNPIDILEQLVIANDWPFARTSDSELAIEVAGRWCGHHLCFLWDETTYAVFFSSHLDLKVPAQVRGRVLELIGTLNERLWIGHFELNTEDGGPMFRHTLPLRGTAGASAEQLEDLVDTATVECERVYSALQLVMWGGRSVGDAIAAAAMDPVGEA